LLQEPNVFFWICLQLLEGKPLQVIQEQTVVTALANSRFNFADHKQKKRLELCGLQPFISSSAKTENEHRFSKNKIYRWLNAWTSKHARHCSSESFVSEGGTCLAHTRQLDCIADKKQLQQISEQSSMHTWS
jgi:hypothetical protein